MKYKVENLLMSGMMGEPLPQSARIVLGKFGGVRLCHDALKKVGLNYHIQAIYHWLHTGLIPPDVWDKVLEAARLSGVVLQTDDFWPGEK